MTKKEIRAVAADRGGWNALEPPLRHALNDGHVVRVCLAGTCAEQFSAGTLMLNDRFDIHVDSPDMETMDEFIAARGDYLLVVGASQSEEGVAATRNALLQPRTTARFGVEDMYLSMVPILQHTLPTLDRLCVINTRARQLFLQKLPDMAGKVSITGGPQFDHYINAHQYSKRGARGRALYRHSLRNEMGVVADEPVFLVVGGLNGTVEMLQLLTEGIIAAGLADHAKIIVRPHPRSTTGDQESLQAWRETHGEKWLAHDPKIWAQTSDVLLPGVDFVLSGYSTTNYLAVLWQMPGVIYVRTPAIQHDLFQEKGLRVPPEVEAGMAWYATTGDTIAKAIRAVYLKTSDDQELAQISRQQRIFASTSYNDGHATERVWQEMQKLM